MYVRLSSLCFSRPVVPCLFRQRPSCVHLVFRFTDSRRRASKTPLRYELLFEVENFLYKLQSAAFSSVRFFLSSKILTNEKLLSLMLYFGKIGNFFPIGGGGGFCAKFSTRVLFFSGLPGSNSTNISLMVFS